MRAHQAIYSDDLLAGDCDWGYCGVGLLKHDVRIRDAMRSQECLYTVVKRDTTGDRARVIGSVVEFLFAPDDPQAVLEKMASPECRIVSLTITEGGYYNPIPSPSVPLGVSGIWKTQVDGVPRLSTHGGSVWRA